MSVSKGGEKGGTRKVSGFLYRARDGRSTEMSDHDNVRERCVCKQSIDIDVSSKNKDDFEEGVIISFNGEHSVDVDESVDRRTEAGEAAARRPARIED